MTTPAAGWAPVQPAPRTYRPHAPIVPTVSLALAWVMLGTAVVLSILGTVAGLSLLGWL